MTAIDPYLALIHDEKKVERLKIAHARRVFIESVPVLGAASVDEDDDEASVAD